MPAVQTTYPTTLRPALAGMKADMTPELTVSRIVESGTGIGFGAAVVQGTGDRQVRPLTAAPTAAFIGVTLIDPTVTTIDPPANPDLYPDKDIAVVLQKGTIWVLTGAAVTAGQPVYVIRATGAFTNVVGTDNILVPNARYESSAASGALAIVKLL